jgi:uncharacterized protein involved in propanediol utilization
MLPLFFDCWKSTLIHFNATTSGRAELVNEVRKAAKVCGPQDLGRAGSLSELLETRHALRELLLRPWKLLAKQSKAMIRR